MELITPPELGNYERVRIEENDSIPTFSPNAQELEDGFPSCLHDVLRPYRNYGMIKVDSPEGGAVATLDAAALCSLQSEVVQEYKTQRFIPIGGGGSHNQLFRIEEGSSIQGETYMQLEGRIWASRGPSHRSRNLLLSDLDRLPAAPAGSTRLDLEEEEAEYWKFVCEDGGSAVTPYASELNLQINRTTSVIRRGFDLNRLGSLLDVTRGDDGSRIPGVQTPFAYVGGFGSSFGSQHQPGKLGLITLLSKRSTPKRWHAILPQHETRYLTALKSAIPASTNGNGCRAYLQHGNIIPTKEFLEAHEIPYIQTWQFPGQYLILFPGVIHWGFNTFYCAADSVNWAHEDWLATFMLAETGSDSSCGCGDVISSCSSQRSRINMIPLVLATRGEAEAKEAYEGIHKWIDPATGTENTNKSYEPVELLELKQNKQLRSKSPTKKNVDSSENSAAEAEVQTRWETQVYQIFMNNCKSWVNLEKERKSFQTLAAEHRKQLETLGRRIRELEEEAEALKNENRVLNQQMAAGARTQVQTQDVDNAEAITDTEEIGMEEEAGQNGPSTSASSRLNGNGHSISTIIRTSPSSSQISRFNSSPSSRDSSRPPRPPADRTCKHCRRTFPYPNKLKRHSCIHALPPAMIHQCPDCPKAFRHKVSYSRHRHEAHLYPEDGDVTMNMN